MDNNWHDDCIGLIRAFLQVHAPEELLEEDPDDDVNVDGDSESDGQDEVHNVSLDSMLSILSMASIDSEDEVAEPQQEVLLAEQLAARLHEAAAAAAAAEAAENSKQDDEEECDEDEYIDVVDEDDHEVAQILNQLSDSSDDSYSYSDDTSDDSSDVSSSDDDDGSTDSSDDSDEDSSDTDSDSESYSSSEEEEDISVPISSSESESEEDPRVPPIYDPLVDHEHFMVPEDSGLDSSVEIDKVNQPIHVGGMFDLVNNDFNILIFGENGLKTEDEVQVQHLINGMVNNPHLLNHYRNYFK